MASYNLAEDSSMFKENRSIKFLGYNNVPTINQDTYKEIKIQLLTAINNKMQEEDEPYKILEDTEEIAIEKIIEEKSDSKGCDDEVSVIVKPFINSVVLPVCEVISKQLGGISYRQLKLTAIRDGNVLDEVSISIEDLLSERWIYKHWGASIRLYNTKVSMAYLHLRQFIQANSKYIPTVHIYNYHGWLEDTSWTYLHGGGAIGYNGTQSILSDDSIAEYTIKTTDISEERACLFVIKTMMNIAEEHLSWSSLAFTFLSLITSKLQKAGIKPEHVLYIEGLSGTRKTSLSKKVFNFHEKLLDNVPIHFDMCTQPAMEIMGMKLRDCVCLYDDVPPAKDEVTKRNQEKKMEALIRTYGESIGRQKMHSANKKIEMKPGGLAAVTAESLIVRNASSISRILRIKVDKNSVDLKRLTKAQNRKYHMPTAITYYIKHIAEKGDSFLSDFIERFYKNREYFTKEAPHVHGRLIQAAAWQLTSLSTYLEYAQSVLPLHLQRKVMLDVKKTIKKYEGILTMMIKDQQQLISQENEVNMFVKAAKELFATNKVRLLKITPDGKKKTVKDDYTQKDVAGFIDSEYIYLFKDTFYGLVCSYYGRQNRSFPVDMPSLLESLHEKKLLKPDNNKDNSRTVRITVNDNRIRIIRIDRDMFENWDDNGSVEKFFSQED